MKKSLILMAALVLVATAASCASTQGTTRPTLEQQVGQLAEQVKQLQNENRQLKAHPQVQIDPSSIPPPAHRNFGRPQRWAWVHRSPDGCHGGPLALQIDNHSGLHLKVLLDGEPIVIRDANTLLNAFPSQVTVYVCLDGPGIHTLEGMAYTNRYGQGVPVAKFSQTVDFPGYKTGGQYVVIDRYWLKSI